MRKSISNMYFTATAVLLIAGILVMGLVQMYLSVSYFVDERQEALTSVVEVAARQVSRLEPDEPLPRLDTDELDEMGERLELIGDTSASTLLMADADGRILLAVGAPGASGKTLPAELLDKAAGGETCFTTDTLGGIYSEKYYTAARMLTDAGGHVRGYIAASTTASATNAYVADMFSTFVLSAGLMLLISSILSAVFTNRLTSPMRHIAEAARKFGSGDFSVRVPVEGDDEVAQLALTFTNMASNLESIDSSRSNFMGNIAHELRTPMTSIKGFVDGMMDGTIPPELHRHYLGVVSGEVGRLTRLIQNMLDISKLEAGEYKVNARSYDVWESITGAALAAEQRIENGSIQIEGLVPDRTFVYADPDLVHQVVSNLLDNAIKFTPEGGTIRFGVRKAGGEVTVSLWNTGAGIAPEALPFVFDRFFKEDRSRGLNAKGSGLGLHICKVLVGLSGGKIWADSREGEWCMFCFTLPADPPRRSRGK